MTDPPRTTFRFSRQEADFACLLRRTASTEAQAVRDLTGHEDLRHAPAATLLHVLVGIGMQTVQEQAEKARHAQLAEFLATDPEHQAWHASRRARRIHRPVRQETA